MSSLQRFGFSIAVLLLAPGLFLSCTTSPKNRSLAVRVPPVVTIGVQPLPLAAAFVVPESVKAAVYREQVWCVFSKTNLVIQTGPGLEKGAMQALPQAFGTIEVVREKSTASQYDVTIEPSVPDVKLTTGCNWLPWDRASQQAKVLLHMVVTSRTGEVLLDNTYASEPHTKDSPADAIGEAYAEVLEAMVHSLASSPKIRAYAKDLPTLRDDIQQTTAQDVKDALDAGIAGVGFAAGFGYVITNYHVVAGLPQVRVFLQDTIRPATVALRDRTNDVALLRLELKGRTRNGAQEVKPLTGLRLGDASKVKTGERVWTLAMASRDDGKAAITEGSIVALSGSAGDRRFFQVSLPLPPGNSGSPLFNEHGEVIGLMVSAGDTPEGYSQPPDLPRNVSLAVKSSYAKTLLGMLPESEFLALSSEPLPAQSPSALAELLRPQVVLIAGSE
jgi:S1-C subfamily serine protease